jgi:hypothetical protein
LQAVLQGSPEAKYKRPLNFLVSSLRQIGAETNAGPALRRYLGQMGQPLFDWPTPDGYPDTAEAWQGNLLPRWQFALDLAQNRISGTEFDLETYLGDVREDYPGFFLDRIATNLLGCSLNPGMEIELINTLDKSSNNNPRQSAELLVAGILASPAFQWR